MTVTGTDVDERTRDDLTAAIADLRHGAEKWVTIGAAERALLMREVHTEVARVRARWATTAATIKGLEADSRYVGEEWISGPYATLNSLAAFAESLDAISSGRSPVDGYEFTDAPGGRVALQVMPHGLSESLLMSGHRAEVWFQPGIDQDSARATAGLASRVGGAPAVTLVLGAGNITSIPPLDVLTELLAHNRTVLLKLNPVMAPMMSVFRSAFAPLIRDGYLEIVQGDGAVGAWLTQAPGIDQIHITGSILTHDAIVWGTGDEGTRRRADQQPKLGIPITSELGGVSPIIVVPGEWSEADIRHQAAHVATMRLHNNGHNCIAGQALIVSSDWPQRQEFLDAIADVMAEVPARAQWYPGTLDRLDQVCSSYPDARSINGRVLFDASGAPHAMENTEYFAPALGVIDLPGTGAEFLMTAVAHANDELLGTLGANVIVSPAVRKKIGPAFDAAIADLRYGTIAINAWTAIGFLTARAPWGAFPGATIADVESGIGVVHNALLLADTERTIVNGPFRPAPRSLVKGELSLTPTPPWFVTARTAAKTGERLANWSADPSFLRMQPVFLSAFMA